MSTSNHSSTANAYKSEAPLCVWFFHDHRLGHLKQLQGLAYRLEIHANIQCCWLDIYDAALGLKHILVPPQHLQTLPRPDIILGAGHKTHLSVLLAARHFQAFSAVIMKPSLPLGWFDALICPEHDQLPSSEKILNTFGPLNTVIPPEQNENQSPRSKHLILLGGPSRHFRFDTHSLISQIQQLCRENPQTSWTLSNSPRTPMDMMAQLRALALPNLNIHDYQDQTLEPLEKLLCSAQKVWLTPDSMAMIFEALTAGARVGIFEDRACPGKTRSRINLQIQKMIQNQIVTSFGKRTDLPEKPNAPAPALWEADRAARWLLQCYANHQKQVSSAHA